MASIHYWQRSSTMELQVPEPWNSPSGPSYIYSPLPTIFFSQPSPTSHFSSSFSSQTSSSSSNSSFESSFYQPSFCSEQETPEHTPRPYIKQETPESTTSPSIKQESPLPRLPNSIGRPSYKDIHIQDEPLPTTMAPYMFEDPFQAGINSYMGAGFDYSLPGSISLPLGNAHYVPNGITYVAEGLPCDVPMVASQPWGVTNFAPAGLTYGFPTGMSQFPNTVNYAPNVGNNVLPGRVQKPVWAQNSEPAQPAGFDGTARPSAQLCQDANGDGGVDTIVKNREARLPEEALKAAATIREKYPQIPKEVYASFLIPPPKGDRVARNEYADRMREYKIPHGLIIKLGQMECAEATLRGGLRNKRLPAKQRPRSSDDIWNDQYVGALLLAVSEVQKRMGIPSYSIHGIVWEEVADEMHKLMGPTSFKFSSIAVSRRYKCQDPFEGDVEKKNKKKILKKKN